MATNIVLLYIVLLAILIVAAVYDLRYQKIPNLLTYSTMALAICYHTQANGLPGFLFCSEGLALGVGLFIFPFLIGQMGAGDAKLMGAVGAILGPKAVFICTVSTALFGGLHALIYLIINKKIFRELFKRLKKTAITFLFKKEVELAPSISASEKKNLCYGPSIALGTCLYMFLQVSGYANHIALTSL